MTERRRPRLAVIAGVSAIALTVPGCHVTSSSSPDSALHPTSTSPSAASGSVAPATTQAVAALQTLPSLEGTTAQVKAAMAQVVSAANAAAPGLNWAKLNGEGAGDRCDDPYAQTDGQRFFLPDAVADRAAITEQAWAAIAAAAKDAAATVGATDMQVMHDAPGNHDVGFYGPAGIFLKVGFQGNLVISGFTGCRLPAGKK